MAEQYLRKGSKVYIEGSLRTRKWQDKQTGQDRYSTDIVAREMQMLDSRGGASQDFGGQQASAPAPQFNQQQAAPAAPQNFDNFDDDIPF
mgnify:CR=1 FL=1